jgi:hypothetical protein
MRSDEEVRKDLRIGELFAGESTHFPLEFQVNTNCGGVLAVSAPMPLIKE